MRKLTRGWIAALGVLTGVLLPTHCLAAPPAGKYFKIKVVDDQTGRGVPLVELRTVDQASFWTDSNGLVAFHVPGLMGQKVFFYVKSHGYELAKDGFGFAGKALDVKEGASAEIKIKRLNVAERLYRITGTGIYRDSVLLGEPVPLAQPVLNAQVAGQDSVMAMPWQGKIWWLWGDTGRPRYPLGLFRASGATSRAPDQGGLDPAKGIDLEYFTGPDGFSRAMTAIEGPGLVWLEGLLVAPDHAGKEHLVVRYTRMKDLGTMLEHGLGVLDPEANVFRKRVEFDLKEPWRCPRGHPIAHQQNGKDYFLFPAPFATVRCPRRLESLADPAAYEAFTCLEPGTKYAKESAWVERGRDGRVVWGWKLRTDPITSAQERDLIASGRLKAEEAYFQPSDIETRKPVEMHSGSIRWNPFRGTWILIAVQAFGGPSFLGEVWFSESDAPTGPWRWAKKIVTHEKYSFYNPVHHDFFDQQEGRIIYFEGTYASTFSGAPSPTPRYDYNQIMYRLDLSDPRLPRPLVPSGAKPSGVKPSSGKPSAAADG
jgi:hypothetical protein